jgi:hypothetical protein
MIHALTGTIPFYTMYGYNPQFTWDVIDDIPRGEAPVAHKRAVAINEK